MPRLKTPDLFEERNTTKTSRTPPRRVIECRPPCICIIGAPDIGGLGWPDGCRAQDSSWSRAVRTPQRFSTPVAAGRIVPIGAGSTINEERALLCSHPHARRRKGRDSGILVLRNGVLIGGGPYFWSTGSYTVGNGTWKGHLRTNQHTPFADRFSYQRIFGDIRR